MILNKRFFLFNFLNAIDKFLIFLIPFLPLLLFDDQLLYNEIEYIYSLSLVIYIFTDGGIKNYSLVFFRSTKNKKKFLKENFDFINTISLYYFCFFVLPLFLIFLFYEKNIFYILIFFRILLLINTNYHKVHFSLKNKKKFILALTLLVSTFTLIYISIRFYFFDTLKIYDYFLFQIIIIFLLISYNFVKKNYLNFKKTFYIFKKSLVFSFPLILNALIFLFIMHFIKIYSYNYLEDKEMTQISFITRFMLIILVLHSGFLNFFYKKFFETKTKKFDLKILKSYFFTLTLSGFLVIITYPLASSMLGLNYKIDLIFKLIFAYTFIWCVSAFFEQYLNKFYQNKYILFYSIISLVLYILIIVFLNQYGMLERMCLAMLVSVSVYFVLILSKCVALLNER